MSSRRPSLAESMRAVAEEPSSPTPRPPAPPIAETPERAKGFYAATRAGKKKVTAALDPPMHKRLKNLAVERDTTTEALLVEAIADLFKKHGKPAAGL
jgi:hypothetical protein